RTRSVRRRAPARAAGEPPATVFRTVRERASGDPHRLFFFGERFEKGVVGVGELPDPFLLELARDDGFLDSELREAPYVVRGYVEVVGDADFRVAVVAIGGERLGRHRIHGVRRDESLDVVEVG